MKNITRLWTLMAAIALSACGGLGQADLGTGGLGGATGTGGSTGSGGVTIHFTTSSADSEGAGGAGTAGATSIGAVPPMIVDGTGSPPPMGVDGAGTTGYTTPTVTTTTTTTTTAVDAGIVSTAGQLTAGTWDDNLNFSFYSTYLSTSAAAQLAGMPVIDRSNRLVIVIKGIDGLPVAGAAVQVFGPDNSNWTSTTGAEGRVIYFPAWASVATGGTVSILAHLSGDSIYASALVTAGTVELTLAQTRSAQPVTGMAVGGLDLAFVIDTTGSMADELSYVQRELDSIVGGIATQFPGLAQRWALVLYRDEGDDYVVRSFDFTSNLSTFRQNLAAQSAGGGNDLPEAVDQALAAAAKLGWSEGATARLAFWIADAPNHVGKEGAVVSALAAASARAVHIYPVAASGINDLGEFTMRTAAEVTGGRYLFLTNDSGIGGSHAEPHIPCYYVTTLTSAMRRMVATEVTGSYLPPAPSDILRTGGDPQNQQCTLSTGEPVTAW